MITMANSAVDYQLDFVYEPSDNGAPLSVHLRDVDGNNLVTGDVRVGPGAA